MKKIIWIVVIVLVVWAIYYYATSDRPEAEVNVSVEASGVVSEIDLEGVALDGPALVTIEASDGGMHVVAVPSMGINLCVAVEDIADVYSLEVGEEVSVRGEMDEEGRIVPCTDESHYLRVAEEAPATE